MLLKMFVAAGVWLAALQISDITAWGFRRALGRKETDPVVKKIRWGLAGLLVLAAVLAFYRSAPEKPRMLKIVRMAVIYLAVFKFGDLTAKSHEWLCRKTDAPITQEYRTHNKMMRWGTTAALLIFVSVIASLGFFGILFAMVGLAILALFLK